MVNFYWAEFPKSCDGRTQWFYNCELYDADNPSKLKKKFPAAVIMDYTGSPPHMFQHVEFPEGYRLYATYFLDGSKGVNVPAKWFMNLEGAKSEVEAEVACALLDGRLLSPPEP